MLCLRRHAKMSLAIAMGSPTIQPRRPSMQPTPLPTIRHAEVLQVEFQLEQVEVHMTTSRQEVVQVEFQLGLLQHAVQV